MGYISGGRRAWTIVVGLQFLAFSSHSSATPLLQTFKIDRVRLHLLVPEMCVMLLRPTQHFRRAAGTETAWRAQSRVSLAKPCQACRSKRITAAQVY